MKTQIITYPASSGKEVLAAMLSSSKNAHASYADLSTENKATLDNFISTFCNKNVAYIENCPKILDAEIRIDGVVEIYSNETLDYTVLSASDKAKYDAFVAMVETL